MSESTNYISLKKGQDGDRQAACEVKPEVSHSTNQCNICRKENVSLLLAEHKQFGMIRVCRDCWERLWVKNEVVTGSGSGSGCSCGSCGS